MTKGSLAGVRVVDVTSNVAGPFATRILADLGADVVKVERPDGGDDTRGWGPPFWNGIGLTFLDLNRNKRSVVLDLDKDADCARLLHLVDQADVFVQNLRPGTLARRGFGPDELLARREGLVYCDITGFGDRGPQSEAPAYDPLVQAFSGLMSITGEEGRPPVRIPVSILDKGAAMWAVIGILDALRTRDRTGVGGVVRTSLLETALAWESVQVLSYLASGVVPPRLGSGAAGIAPYEVFAAADGDVVIAAGNDRIWTRLCDALDSPELLADVRFGTNAERFANRLILRELLQTRTRTLSVAELVGRLDAAGVPVSEVKTIDQVLEHPQVIAMDPVAMAPHPAIPDGRMMRLPVRASNGAELPDRPAPSLGEHDEDVFGTYNASAAPAIELRS